SSSGVSPLWPRSRPQRGDCLRGVLGEWHFLKGVFILQRHRRPWFSIPLLSPVWSAVFSSRNQFQVGTSRRHLGEFGQVIALILLGFMERPIRIEIAIDHQRSEFENGFASLQSPLGPRDLHAIMDKRPHLSANHKIYLLPNERELHSLVRNVMGRRWDTL